MDLDQVLSALGYSDRPGRFLRAGTAEFRQAENYGHIFRHAAKQPCSLKGVYQLSPPEDGGPAVPVVYVCEAKDEVAARRVHQLVWNQDIVPFVLVYTPRGIRLYSGFEFSQSGAGNPDEGLLAPLVQFNQIHELLEPLSAESIDSGRLWRHTGMKIRPEKRVYWQLLESLRKLDRWLRDNGLQSQRSRHALMGKYVYLHYLEGRGILSAERLERWGIERSSVFGRKATAKGLAAITAKLDGFLNGRVFPLKFRGKDAPTDEHVQRVAATFAGDEIEEKSWQLHLDFQAYDFSYIPIETISMIYEQFLHMPEEEGAEESDEASEGRKAGAYYTPIPVVNFMLAELDQHRPLHRGVTCYDPSCGSGAFLVQCFRKLVERVYPPGRKKPTPFDLKRLLQTHIFGTDMDDDACSVAEFSLVLTLLDYVTPPDLLEHPRFRLPDLRNRNIFHSDFFNEQLRLPNRLGKRRFHWVVGNPPWKRLETTKLEDRDKRALKWMKDNAEKRPVGKYALSQAFTWRCAEFLHAKGEAALLLPAMTLFEDVSEGHRRAFFNAFQVHTVANFANLAEVLFAGRSRVPAAAIIFRSFEPSSTPDPETSTAFFSPLIANQEQNRPSGPGERNEVWSMVINGNEIRDLRYADIASGSGLPWKLAMWGSPLDQALIRRMERKWKKLGELEAKWKPTKREFVAEAAHQLFMISEGPQLKEADGDGRTFLDEVKDKRVLDVELLKDWTQVFSFAQFNLPENKHLYLRERGGWKGLHVCRPPHVMVSAARNFAVFSDEYLVVWSRQIGIGSPSKDADMLKALALYLNSDFAYYHAFLSAAELGVKRDRANLDGIKQLPCPLSALQRDQIREWAALHDHLAQTSPRRPDDDENAFHDGQPQLLERLNQLIAEALGLSERDQALIHDLVHVKLALNDGQVRPAAMNPPSPSEIQTYAEWLQRELDDFIGEDFDRQHAVSVLHDERSGFVAIDFTTDTNRWHTVSVREAGSADAATLRQTRDRLRREHSQWVYFDRDLRIYQGRRTFLFKPLERFHWTRTQAMLDATEIIGDTLSSTPSPQTAA